MTTEDRYLRSVERMLRRLTPEHRTAVLDDLRGHFADAADAGRTVGDTIAGLGTPKQIAERAAEEFGTDDAPADRAWRVLQGAALATAVVVGVVVAFIMPSYATGDGQKTLAEMSGLWVALIALIPAVVAVVPLVVPRAARTAASSVCTVLLLAMALIGGFTLGGFFLPSALLCTAALVAWVRLRASGFGLGWRITGAVLAALPVAGFLAVTGGLPGRYADPSTGTGPAFELSAWSWPFFAAVLALATLVAVGYRAGGWALAAIGALLLVAGLASGGLLTLLIVWLGGWWLTIGLAHAVTAPRRR